MPQITQIQVRRAVSGPSTTVGTWANVNPKLAAGEIGFETDTGKFKIGDGNTFWNSLLYATDTSELVGSSLPSTITTASGLTSIGTLGSLSVSGGATISGTLSANTLTGNGSGITNLTMGNAAGATTLAGQYGGTGVANTGKTISVSGNTQIGSSTHTVTLNTSGNTSVTLPTSGTLALNDLSNVTPATGRSALEVQKQPLFYTGPETATTISSNVTSTFVGPYNKGVTLEANTVYEMEIVWHANIQTTSATAAGIYNQFNYTGGALDSTNPIYGNILMYSGNIGRDAQVTATVSAYSLQLTTTSLINAFGPNVSANSANNFRVFVIKGIVRTSTAGKFWWGVAVGNSADATYTTYKNSYIKLTPLGTNSGNTVSNGAWT